MQCKKRVRRVEAKHSPRVLHTVPAVEAGLGGSSSQVVEKDSKVPIGRSFVRRLETPLHIARSTCLVDIVWWSPSRALAVVTSGARLDALFECACLDIADVYGLVGSRVVKIAKVQESFAVGCPDLGAADTRTGISCWRRSRCWRVPLYKHVV